ncbi:MAG: choice-of-anchor D domain-containing protein, partial [Calditrichaeota bacterium]|nr:choice-of-anchor D domain-containing protein [Calditrichota bacterium]
SGTDPGSFAIRDGGAPFSLAPGDSQIISVTFLPVTAGEKSASLNLTTNVPGMENVSIALSGNGVAPDISVAPDSLDFGSIFVNTTSIKNVLITNTGDTTLSIVNIRITGLNYGSFDTANITAAFDIEPGETDTIMVRFKPAVAIEHLANLEITSNDPDEEIVNVPLRGIALPTPIPNIVVSSDSLGFGTVVLGNSTSLSLIISNDGTAPLEVSALDLSGSTPEAFATNATPPITINPGDSQSVEIVFTPQSEGQKAALLSILNNDPDMPEVQVILTGTGVATPTIRISSNLLNFADVAPSDSADQSVTVYNDGTATLDIVNIEVTTDSAGAEFKLLSAPSGTILPGDSLILDVRFTGISAGIKTGSLNIFSNDPQMGSTTVALTGRVIVPDIAAIPPSIAIVDVPINTTVSAILKIVNDATATAELNVSASTVVGDTMEFKITSGAAPFTLQPGDTQMVTVAYTAITTDTSYAQLHFTSNDPDENPFVVPLKGNGIIPFAHDFIFLANDRMSYESALRVEGNSFSNNVINIHDGISGVQNGNLTAVNDVELRHNNTLNGNITYGKEVLVEGTLNGSIFKDNDLQPIELPILSFSAGGANITVSEFDTLNLEPGSYENADIFGLLVLKPGKYYFKRIDFQKDSRLLVDATDGLVEMNVV